MKVVYNTQPGRFGLSHLARHYYLSGCAGFTEEYDEEELEVQNLDRHDPLLVKCVQDLRGEANGMEATLAIREVQDLYRIEVDHHGVEKVITPEDPIEWISAMGADPIRSTPCGAYRFRGGYIEKLDGYRELGGRAAAAENERDKALRERHEASEELGKAMGLLREAYRELATIEAITVSPSGVDGLLELVNRIGTYLKEQDGLSGDALADLPILEEP